MSLKMTRTSQAERTAKKKEHILQCAQKLFDERGYENVTIREIANRSGSSIGSIYHHFRDKSALLTWTITYVEDRYREAYRTIEEDPDLKASWLRRLKEFFVQVQMVCIELGDATLRAAYLNGLRYPEFETLKTGKERVLYKFIIELLTQCREEGSISSSLSENDIFDQFVVTSRGLLV
ncbi:MAG: TetR/AcrR family transcriptional regulator, partial [Synergistaceae bacterium]|nr:TetR/AcrR family transcriptional regulator [Synergistaceae bacterium]